MPPAPGRRTRARRGPAGSTAERRGPEGEWLGADRRDADGALRKPVGATQMGLIYVNPQGPGGNSDPQAAAHAIREAFGRMAMNDEETAALIAGGHTFGKAQDPVPEADHALIDERDAVVLKAQIVDSGLTTAELVRAAWASASTFRGTDMRGGANGARVRLAPQREWLANDPGELAGVLETLAGIRSRFNDEQTGGKRVSLADGMRALDANAGGSAHGVFTDRPGTLSNDFFVNLTDMSTVWARSSTEGLYEGRDRATGDLKWTATPVDLIFGSSSELRAVAEFYAADDAQDDFVRDFVAAWTKVMTLDRFDLE